MTRGFFIFIITIFIISQFVACESPSTPKTEIPIAKTTVKKSHLSKIRAQGKLIVSTDYNSHGYFIYRGTPMGFQFELLNSFANFLGVKLEISVRNNLNEALIDIKKNKCDLLAMDLAITAERRKNMLFTEPIYQSRQVLVQKMPNNWRKMHTWDEIETHLLRDAINLQGKTVHIQKGSVFYNRLNHINIETGGDINIIEDDLSVDELIEKVENGEIEYTVCDSHVGAINKKYHKNIDIETQLGAYSQNLAWALSIGSDSLLMEINQWLKEYKKSKEFYYVYNKYFKNSRTTMMAKSEYNSNQGGKISPYDELIKKI